MSKIIKRQDQVEVEHECVIIRIDFKNKALISKEIRTSKSIKIIDEKLPFFDEDLPF